jgi:tetratricopeptide (TPR) repeat protein
MKHALYKSYYNRALAYRNLAKLDEATKDLNEVLRGEPQNADAYLNLGVICSMRQDFSGSIPYYNKAIAIKPDFAEAYFNRGVSKGNQKLHQDAIPDYDMAIRLRDAFPEAYYSRAVSELNLQQAEKACADLHRARDLGYKPADELIAIHCSAQTSSR